MFKKIAFAAFLACAAGSSLSAYIHPGNGQWSLQGEFLYLLPTFGDTYYAAVGSATVTGVTVSDFEGDKKNNEFDFVPGFRIEGAYGFCDCNELIIRYARLRSTETDTVTGLIAPVKNRFVTNAYLGSATSHLDFIYQNVEVLYGVGAWNGCKFNIDIQTGLEYAYIRLNEQYTSSGTAFPGTPTPLLLKDNFKSKTWGIGPQVGFAFNYDFYDSCDSGCGAFSFVSRAAGSLLVSETKFQIQSENVSTITNAFEIDDDSSWRIVPALHARLGFNYETSFSCVNASFEIGYEFHSYINAHTREIFIDRNIARANSFSQYNNFDANGLYVALGLTF